MAFQALQNFDLGDELSIPQIAFLEYTTMYTYVAQVNVEEHTTRVMIFSGLHTTKKYVRGE